VRVIRSGGWCGGADREPDVESGGRGLEQRAQGHSGSVPQPGESQRQGRVLRQTIQPVTLREGLQSEGWFGYPDQPSGFCRRDGRGILQLPEGR